MSDGLELYLIMWIVSLGSLSLPYTPKLRWAQGWFFPHDMARDKCLFKCATCRA